MRRLAPLALLLLFGCPRPPPSVPAAVKAECQRNQDCGEGQKCAEGKCVAECSPATAQQDCGSGRKCLGGRCAAADACNVDSDCGSGQACIQNRCAAAQACQLKTVHFAFDDSSLSSEARSTLDEDWQCLQKRGNPPLTVAGNCDERGTTEYNVALGQRRAESVRKYLVGLGANGSNIKTVSYGEERPVDPGHNEAAWAKNRRADLTAGAAQ